MKHYICVEDLVSDIDETGSAIEQAIFKRQLGKDVGKLGLDILARVRESALRMPPLTESEICERFAERFKDKLVGYQAGERFVYNYPSFKIVSMIDEILKEISDSN